MKIVERLRERRSRSPWARIAKQPSALPPVGARRILFASSIGGHPVVRVVDGLLAAALRIRGADPSVLLCDATLPACEACEYVDFPDPREFMAHGPSRRLCTACFGRGQRAFAPLPVPLRRYREFAPPNGIAAALDQVGSWSLRECVELEQDGLQLGEQVHAGLVRFFGKADLTTEPDDFVLEAARRYAAGALVSATVAERALDVLEPDVVVSHHGVYVPQGVFGEVARRDGVRVVNWGTSYRDRTLIFSHGDTYHRTMLTEPDEVWDRTLSAQQEGDLMRFLARRRRGEGDWAWVTPEAALRPQEQERDDLIEKLGIDTAKHTSGLLTNVLWDAQLYYQGHAFENMLDWLWFTLDWFVEHPERQLIVRIHPHEVKRGNRQPVLPEIERRYSRLPPNVFVVPHDSPVNTYALMELCEAVLIYGTKTGVELTPLGKRVVVAGDAWIKNKGLTTDVGSRLDYASVLAELPSRQPLDASTVERARRYAYHYFFRRMIPFDSLQAESLNVQPAITSFDDLRPGRDGGLDVVCAGILDGTPFVYDG